VRRIALKSLLHDRGKAGAALAGVAFATTLLLVQSGVYLGFLETSAGLISRVGGDVWVMARGARRTFPGRWCAGCPAISQGRIE
jgi:hypothetical protein